MDIGVSGTKLVWVQDGDTSALVKPYSSGHDDSILAIVDMHSLEHKIFAEGGGDGIWKVAVDSNLTSVMNDVVCQVLEKRPDLKEDN